MKNELTNEQIADASRCQKMRIHGSCAKCKMDGIGKTFDFCIEGLSKALQAERAKPKDDVWKDAPEWAVCATGTYHEEQVDRNPREDRFYFTRPLPKTLEEELLDKYNVVTDRQRNIILDMLKEYAARIKE